MDYFAMNICLCSSEEMVEYSFKGTVHPKTICPQVVPNLYEFFFCWTYKTFWRIWMIFSMLWKSVGNNNSLSKLSHTFFGCTLKPIYLNLILSDSLIFSWVCSLRHPVWCRLLEVGGGKWKNVSGLRNQYLWQHTPHPSSRCVRCGHCPWSEGWQEGGRDGAMGCRSRQEHLVFSRPGQGPCPVEKRLNLRTSPNGVYSSARAQTHVHKCQTHTHTHTHTHTTM